MSGQDSEKLLDACINCIRKEIIPLTLEGVSKGSKVFGAAILRKADLSTVIASTNNELENPMWHGEVHCIKQFYELKAQDRPRPQDCIFLTTHEPCSLCLSAITWSGFDCFYYLFTYEDSRDLFAIPHDINILEQVYKVPAVGETPENRAARPLYNKVNAFFSSASLADIARNTGREEQYVEELSTLKREYDSLSVTYQQNKGKAPIAFA